MEEFIMGEQVERLIKMLQDSLFETVEVLSYLDEEELGSQSEHDCALGGTVRGLLMHNIDHERIHTGQVYGLRYILGETQTNEVHRLMAETIRARAGLIGSLIGLPDETLAKRTPDDKWTIQEVIEHAIYWERDSMADLIRNKLQDRVPSELPRFPYEITDPIEGKLKVV
jgi:hypothetical protein